MKSVHSEEYRLLTSWLVDKRVKAGLTQIDLAQRLGKNQSYVSKYENGERRLDLVEFLAVTQAIGANPFDIITKLVDKNTST